MSVLNVGRARMVVVFTPTSPPLSSLIQQKKEGPNPIIATVVRRWKIVDFRPRFHLHLPTYMPIPQKIGMMETNADGSADWGVTDT